MNKILAILLELIGNDDPLSQWGRVPSINVTKDELCFLRNLEMFQVLCGGNDEEEAVVPTMLFECVLLHLQLNEGRMPNLKWLTLWHLELALAV